MHARSPSHGAVSRHWLQRCDCPTCWTTTQQLRPAAVSPLAAPAGQGAPPGCPPFPLLPLCPAVPRQVGQGLQARGAGESSFQGLYWQLFPNHCWAPRFVLGDGRGEEEDEGFGRVFLAEGSRCPWDKEHRQGITYGEHLWSGTTNHQGLLNVKVGKWAGCFSRRARGPISSEMWKLSAQGVPARHGATAH